MKRLLVGIGDLYGAQASTPLLTGRWRFPAVMAADTAAVAAAAVGVATAHVSVFVVLLGMLHVNDCPCLADTECSEHGIRS